MSDPFERFYTTRVKLLTIEKPQGYDRSDVKITELGSVMADVQPYRGGMSVNNYGLIPMEYGLSEECQMRMFCRENEHLQVGNYAEINGERYRIVYTASRLMGAEALLREVSA